MSTETELRNECLAHLKRIAELEALLREVVAVTSFNAIFFDEPEALKARVDAALSVSHIPQL